jgi:hypothetical protein
MTKKIYFRTGIYLYGILLLHIYCMYMKVGSLLWLGGGPPYIAKNTFSIK